MARVSSPLDVGRMDFQSPAPVSRAVSGMGTPRPGHPKKRTFRTKLVVDKHLPSYMGEVPSWAYYTVAHNSLVMETGKHDVVIEAFTSWLKKEWMPQPKPLLPDQVSMRLRSSKSATTTILFVLSPAKSLGYNENAPQLMEKARKLEEGQIVAVIPVDYVLRLIYAVLSSSAGIQCPETWEEMPSLFKRVAQLHDVNHFIIKSLPPSLSLYLVRSEVHLASDVDLHFWKTLQKYGFEQERVSDFHDSSDCGNEKKWHAFRPGHEDLRHYLLHHVIGEHRDQRNLVLLLHARLVNLLQKKNVSPSMLHPLSHTLHHLIKTGSINSESFVLTDDLHSGARDLLDSQGDYFCTLISRVETLAREIRILMKRLKEKKDELRSIWDEEIFGMHAKGLLHDSETLWRGGDTSEVLRFRLPMWMCVLADLLVPNTITSVFGTLLTRGLSSVYNRFLDNYGEMKRVRENHPVKNRGGPLTRYLRLSQKAMRDVVGTLLPCWVDSSQGELTEYIFSATVYNSSSYSFDTFVTAGVRTWRLMCLCSLMRVIKYPEMEKDSFKVMPLYPSLVDFMVTEKDVMPLAQVFLFFSELFESGVSRKAFDEEKAIARFQAVQEMIPRVRDLHAFLLASVMCQEEPTSSSDLRVERMYVCIQILRGNVSEIEALLDHKTCIPATKTFYKEGGPLEVRKDKRSCPEGTFFLDPRVTLHSCQTHDVKELIQSRFRSHEGDGSPVLYNFTRQALSSTRGSTEIKNLHLRVVKLLVCMMSMMESSMRGNVFAWPPELHIHNMPVLRVGSSWRSDCETIFLEYMDDVSSVSRPLQEACDIVVHGHDATETNDNIDHPPLSVQREMQQERSLADIKRGNGMMSPQPMQANGASSDESQEQPVRKSRRFGKGLHNREDERSGPLVNPFLVKGFNTQGSMDKLTMD